MRALPTLFLIAVTSAALPAVATAQTTAALMPTIGGDEAVSFEARTTAHDAAVEVLREEGLLVIEQMRFAAMLDDVERACVPTDPCVTAVYQRAGVELLIGLTLRGGADAVSEVQVLLIRPTEQREGSATVDGELADAVSDALRPLLDDEDEHAAAEAAEAEAARDAAAIAPEAVELETTEAVPTAPGEATVHWAVVVGAGAIAVGLATAALPPAISFLSSGCTNMTCTEFEEVDDLVWSWIAVGAVVAGAGIGLLIWGASQGDESVTARISPTRISLEGQF